MLQTRTVEDGTLKLLKELMANPILEPFYLVGGTALALQLGHRKSIDIDLFCDESFDQDKLLSGLEMDFEIVSRNSSFLGLLIDGVKTDFVHYPFPRTNSLIVDESIRMCGTLEIATMKIWAITRRGLRKDFVDIYFLLKIYSLEEILSAFKVKFPDAEPLMVIKSLVYFADADNDFEPVLFDEISWEEIKKEISDKVDLFT